MKVVLFLMRRMEYLQMSLDCCDTRHSHNWSWHLESLIYEL